MYLWLWKNCFFCSITTVLSWLCTSVHISSKLSHIPKWKSESHMINISWITWKNRKMCRIDGNQRRGGGGIHRRKSLRRGKKWKLKVKSAAEWTNRPPPFIITTSKSLTEHFSWNWQFGMTLLTYGGNIAVHWFSDVPGMLGESLHCHKNKLWLLMTYWHYIDDPGHSHCTGIG